MLQTTIRDLLDGAVDVTGYQLYVVKDGEAVLYVGQSIDAAKRLRGHISSRVHSYGSLLGKAIYENKPRSEEWVVELYAVDECSDLIKEWFPRAFIASEEATRYAEDALTHQFNPLYNRATNMGHGVTGSPFTQRKKREKEEAHRQWEIQLAEKREYLVNSVCDVCGEHDKWVDFDDMLPCGVLENHHGFKLLCNNCDRVITLMKELERQSDRVRKVEKALAALANA